MASIKWMGAYRYMLPKSSEFEKEFSASETIERAAEPFQGCPSNIRYGQPLVGVLFDDSQIVKSFKGDVNSTNPKVVEYKRRLDKRRNPRQSSLHHEVWVKGAAKAFILRDREDLYVPYPKGVLEAVSKYAKKNNLRIFVAAYVADPDNYFSDYREIKKINANDLFAYYYQDCQ